MLYRFVVVSLLLLAGSLLVDSCVEIMGIDDDSAGALKSADINLPGGIFFSVISSFGGPALTMFETPIALRLSHILVSVALSTLSVYDENALERFGRKDLTDEWRRCTPTSDAEISRFDLHRRVSLMYALSEAFRRIAPSTVGASNDLLSSFGLNASICPGGAGCETTETPWGLVKVIADDAMDIFSRDGWNADGGLSRQFNRIAYQDFRDSPYVPRNPPNHRRWAPLLESDSRGFLFRQEHVTSHIGDTARSLHFSDRELCAKRAPRPRYRYNREIRQLLRRSRDFNLTSRTETFFFDNKLTSLAPLQLQYMNRANVSIDTLQGMSIDAAFVAAQLEAVTLVWRAKVRHDAVRPPTIIARRLGTRRVRAYAGPGLGTQRLPADQWMPYIRTMPHAEYPSGSSCICQAFEESFADIFGVDDVVPAIGGPLTATILSGSNPNEDGTEPDVTLSYSKISDIKRVCSETRLSSGLHFTAAVPEGQKLCSGIAAVVAEDFRKLLRGETPQYSSTFPGVPSGAQRCS